MTKSDHDKVLLLLSAMRRGHARLLRFASKNLQLAQVLAEHDDKTVRFCKKCAAAAVSLADEGEMIIKDLEKLAKEQLDE